MNEAVEKVLVLLDEFRTNNEITYSAYSTLHDEISLLDDLLKEQEPKPVKNIDDSEVGIRSGFCPECQKLIYYKAKNSNGSLRTTA